MLNSQRKKKSAENLKSRKAWEDVFQTPKVNNCQKKIATSKAKFNFYNLQRAKNISTQDKQKNSWPLSQHWRRYIKETWTLRWSNDSHNHKNTGGGEGMSFLWALDEQRSTGNESIMSSLAIHQILIKEYSRNKRINNQATRKRTINVKEVSESLFIITLNVHGFNYPIKRWRLTV